MISTGWNRKKIEQSHGLDGYTTNNVVKYFGRGPSIVPVESCRLSAVVPVKSPGTYGTVLCGIVRSSALYLAPMGLSCVAVRGVLPSIVPVESCRLSAVVPVKSPGTDGIVQCGSVRSSACCTVYSAGTIDWRILAL